MKDPSVAVVCVYNNKEQLESQLTVSLELQDINFTLVAIDNCNNEFSSAAKALNFGAKQTDAAVLVFAHQDVYIKQNDGLREFVEKIIQGSTGNIYGSSGARETEKHNLGVYTSGKEFNNSIIHTYLNPEEVSCLDECFFGMKRETYQMFEFNELLCNDWHLYCVEMCLRARKGNHKIFMVPVQIHHFSNGKISSAYIDCLYRIANQYRHQFRYIWTTAYKVRTGVLYMFLLKTAWQFNRRIICPVKDFLKLGLSI